MTSATTPSTGERRSKRFPSATRVKGVVCAPGADLGDAVAGVGDVVEEGDGQESDDGERHYGDHWSASFPPGATLAVRGPPELQVIWFVTPSFLHRPCHGPRRADRAERAVQTIDKPLKNTSIRPGKPFSAPWGC